MDRMACAVENKIDLRLHIDGRTVSAAGTTTDVEILGYEFRTSALAPQGLTSGAAVATCLKLPREADKTNRARLIQ